MTMNGIDIANYQRDLVPKAMTTTGFIIVKATESNWYVNECFADHAAQTVAAGKLLGCYHFARPGDMAEQADFFLGAVKKYIGKAVFALDWEENAIPLGPKKAKEWLDRVYKKTGVKPVVYMSKGVIHEYDWSAVKAAGYELWVAQYPDYSPTGYRSKDQIWTDGNDFGPWGTWPALFQYTSMGNIKGYGGRLDLELFDGNKDRWDGLTNGSAIKSVITKVTTPTPKVTASKITKMVNHAKDLAADDSHGYSQARRWGPDFDCSSFMYECAHFAGYDVGVGPDATRYTGTMPEDFRKAGFTAVPFDGNLADLDPGDILLNVVNHTEMYVGNGKFAGAHIAETGDVDGQPGDQTGDEISVCDAYIPSFGWDYVLVPPAEDGSDVTPEPEPVDDKTVEFRLSSDPDGEDWLAVGETDSPYAEDIYWIAVKGAGKYRVCTEANGWLPWVTGYDVNDLEDGCAGDGSGILAVEVESSKYRYAVRVMCSVWYADMIGRTDTSGSGDTYAGDMHNTIDGFRIEKA